MGCAIPGIDTETGKRRPRRLGTFNSRRSAQSAATSFAASGDITSDRGSVAHLVDRWADGKIDVSNKTREQYRWAAGHIKTGLGGVRADQLERDDIACWLEALAEEGRLSRRSIQIVRMVLRAALDDAVAVGELRRNPAERVAMPRQVSKAPPNRASVVWTGEIRAAADILGHSPDMLMKTYAHVLAESVRTVTEKIAERGSTRPSGQPGSNSDRDSLVSWPPDVGEGHHG